MPLTKTHGFWPTFRGAVDWMQKHQDIVETALNLIEIYPKLIQHKSCDQVWEFISKAAFFQKKEVSLRDNKTERKTGDIAKMVKELHKIPSISVTESKGNANRHQDVYFCGNTADEKWQSLLIGLSQTFFVASCKEKTLTTSETELETILSADSFIFVIEDKTIKESYYLDQLHTALTWRIPVTFVREPSFTIPDPMPESIFKIPDRVCSTKLGREADNTPTPSTNQENKSKHCRQEARAFSAGVGKLDADIDTQYHIITADSHTLKKPRPLPAYSQSSAGSSISLNLPPISLSSSSIPGSELRKSQSDSSFLSTAEHVNALSDPETIAIDTNLPQDEVVSFPEFLARGYDTAVLYNRLYYRECLERIAAVLKDETQWTDIARNKFPDLVQTNREKGVYKTEKAVVDKAVDDDTDIDTAFGAKSDMTKETKQNMNNKKRVSLESDRSSDRKLSSPIETFYVVYSDSKEGPEIVHWPIRGHEEISGSPSLESFGFQDIDLSLNVNIDLSSSDEN